jgi:nucleotide-binding universal stress UspA family protein
MSGVIVVGVDGSKPSLDALRWAANQARLTGATLEVTTTWEFPTSFGWAPAWPPDWDPSGDARKALAQVVDEVLGSDPGFEVRQVVLEGSPALSLIHAGEKADLLVVGSRGHGEFAGMWLGSVSEHCATHAPCPVVIVRHPHHDKA